MLLNEFMTLDTLAKTFNVSKHVVRRWKDDLGMPTIKVGAYTFVHEPAVAQWLKGRERLRPTEDSPSNGSGTARTGKETYA
jgi:hypothetical protein